MSSSSKTVLDSGAWLQQLNTQTPVLVVVLRWLYPVCPSCNQVPEVVDIGRVLPVSNCDEKPDLNVTRACLP